MWKHPIRSDMLILSRCGFDHNWQPIGYTSLNDFMQQLNKMTIKVQTC